MYSSILSSEHICMASRLLLLMNSAGGAFSYMSTGVCVNEWPSYGWDCWVIRYQNVHLHKMTPNCFQMAVQSHTISDACSIPR